MRRFEEVAKHIAEEVGVTSVEGQKRWFMWNVGANSWFGRNHMVAVYIGVKFLYCANILIQLWLLDSVITIEFYNLRYLSWTMNTLTQGWWLGSRNEQSLYPFMTMCRVFSQGGEQGNLGQNREEHITCNLNINVIHEKFYNCFL